jgi:hypothetical protein
MPGSPRHVNQLISSKRTRPCKINQFTSTCAPRLHRATWNNRANELEIRVDRMLQNLKPFTRVNTNLPARLVHSSHLGVTCQLFLPLQSSAPSRRPNNSPGSSEQSITPMFWVSRLCKYVDSSFYGRELWPSRIIHEQYGPDRLARMP